MKKRIILPLSLPISFNIFASSSYHCSVENEAGVKDVVIKINVEGTGDVAHISFNKGFSLDGEIVDYEAKLLKKVSTKTEMYFVHTLRNSVKSSKSNFDIIDTTRRLQISVNTKYSQFLQIVETNRSMESKLSSVRAKSNINTHQLLECEKK